MKNKLPLLIILILSLFLNESAYCERIMGKVNKEEELSNFSQIIDFTTGLPVKDALVSTPSNGWAVKTDENGYFQLNTTVDKTAILSVQKEGYRPFSLTIDRSSLEHPLRLGIEKIHVNDIVIEKNICHLGDNVFSATSANSSDFYNVGTTPFYNKRFNMKPIDKNARAYLIIGSVIGLDTKAAKQAGQNSIARVYSSPAEIFFNGQKIAEIHLNGDGLEFLLPASLIKEKNDLTIKTGRNLFQYSHVDYDDIELMNITVEIRNARTAFDY